MTALPLSPRPWHSRALALAACIALAGAASIALRQDSSWDLQNYHYYNAWAFRAPPPRPRLGAGAAPVVLQPVPRPAVLSRMVAAGCPPRADRVRCSRSRPASRGTASRASPRMLFAPEAGRRRLAAVAIGVTAPMPVSLIGTHHERLVRRGVRDGRAVAACVAASGAPRARIVARPGHWSVCGAGLKLTGAIYRSGCSPRVAAHGDAGARGAGTSSWRVPRWRSPSRRPPARGWRSWYERFGNPLFPYYNDVFRSPWADPVRFSATRFGPRRRLGGWCSRTCCCGSSKASSPSPSSAMRGPRSSTRWRGAGALMGIAGRSAARGPGARAHWRFLGVFFVASFVAWARRLPYLSATSCRSSSWPARCSSGTSSCVWCRRRG